MTAETAHVAFLSLGVEDGSFTGFIRRLRAGDERAVRELLERYGPAIRRAVRVRLRDPRLQRIVESVDICQSVFASFFLRTALGQYHIESPDQLLRLLATIARNKLAYQARRERASCRDQGRVNMGVLIEDCAGHEPSPSRRLEARELLEEARSRLADDERCLFERRAQGASWAEIAAELGGNPDALRVRLARGVARVGKQLGLGEEIDE
jgi:RNA polymerase sigma factor (sigma-70 family)